MVPFTGSFAEALTAVSIRFDSVPRATSPKTSTGDEMLVDRFEFVRARYATLRPCWNLLIAPLYQVVPSSLCGGGRQWLAAS
jgi:hypothetical protein